MNQRNITVIPGSEKQIISELPIGTEGKIHVVAYAHVPVGKNQDEELRTFFEQIVSKIPEWELLKVVTDELGDDWEASSWKNFFSLLEPIKLGSIDIVLVKSIENLAGCIADAKLLAGIFKEVGSRLRFAQSDESLLSSEQLFML